MEPVFEKDPLDPNRAEESKRLAQETGSTASKRVKRSSKVLQSTSASQLNKGEGQVPKPRTGEPPVWSNTRQQLVDALDWYNSMQGGAAHKDKVCTGFLVDGDNGCRSFMDDEIIITRTGGDSTKVSGKGLSLRKDQSPHGAIIQSVMASFNAQKPVGIIIGSKNKLLKVEIPHRYCVMDWFLITDVWMEKMGEHAGFRMRLEKLDLSTRGWWTELETDSSQSRMISSASRKLNEPQNHGRPPPERVCTKCGVSSKQVYLKPGWMCLQSACPKFWNIRGTEPQEDDVFEYHPDFLSYRKPRNPDVPHPGPLAVIADSSLSQSEGSTDREEWKGIVCPNCRKCIQRTTWDAWDCSNDAARGPKETCSFRLLRRMREIPLESVLDRPISSTAAQLKCEISPLVDEESFSPYELRIYEIPGAGSITHFVSNQNINARPNGPNDLFQQLQKLNLGFRRYPLQSAQVPGTLTSHFAVNYGVPYKYVVSVDSKAFRDAPPEILTALGRLSWATEKAVSCAGDQYQPPNEVLALGYFEAMKIGFHDDGESALGPTIATLSLGTRSKMSIRMKYKYFFGVSKSGVPTKEDPILPGCENEDARLSLRQNFEAGKFSETVYDNRRKALLAHTSKAKKGESPTRLKLELKHGDLVVMHGADLQKYYEHSVEPDKGLRFALTARYIETTDEAEIQKGLFQLADDQIYDGQ